jgi:rhamnogalacturonyl hydrolase YesR
VYLEKAALEINDYLEKLQQPNGLFFHGENAKFFWGRGNGWVAAGLAELLSRLLPDNKYYENIKACYVKMMSSLKNHQCDDGMWRQLIDNERSWKETSGTAMFGYAISEGVKKGIIPEKEFSEVYKKAWNALKGYVSDNGKLNDICTGTGQSTDVNYYLERPKVTGDLHGQAAMLWFCFSLLSEY